MIKSPLLAAAAPFALILSLALPVSDTFAQGAAGSAAGPALLPVTIGYLGLSNDARYAAFRANTEIELAPADDPVLGAQLALSDTRLIANAVGIEVSLDLRRAPDAPGLSDALDAMAAAGERFILLDVPGALAAEVATHAEALKVTLINVSAPDNFLRESCRTALLDVAASDRMKTDALVQFLVGRDWTRVLVLTGPSDRDRLFAQSFNDSARRMRLRIVDSREFSLSLDPSTREQSNTLLITSDADYDVIFVADEGQEFARYLPYRTQLARPVIGSTGLVASAWHWTWDLNGAPQVMHRFLRLSDGIRMTDADWAAWVAVKSIAQAYLRAGSTDPDAVDAYLRGDTLAIDGSKGQTMSYRAWSGQMRQPILLHTADAVIARAPLQGFEHPVNDMDTLGIDRPESACS